MGDDLRWVDLARMSSHPRSWGGNMYHLKKIAGMFNLLSTLRLLWNQHEPTAPLPRLSFDHRDTGGSPLSSRGWAHQIEDNSLGQVSVKDRLQSLILKVSKIKTSSHNPNGNPSVYKKLHKLHGENPWLSVSFKNLRYRWDVVHGWFPPPCQFLSPFGPPQWLLSIYQYWMNYIGSTSLCFINLHTEVYKRN